MDGNLRKILVYLTIFLTIAIMAILGIMLRDVFMTKGVPTNPGEQAYVVAKAMTTKNPKDADAWFRLAKAEADLGRTGDAIAHMKKAIELKPAAPMLHYTLGLIYLDSNKEKEAIAEFQRELQVTGNKNELAWYELGVLMNKKKDYKTAVVYLSNALQRMEAGADAYYHLGKAYEGLGQNDYAMRYYQEALKYIPDHTDTQIAIQQLQAKQLQQNLNKTQTPAKK